jgi:hypothetical protein
MLEPLCAANLNRHDQIYALPTQSAVLSIFISYTTVISVSSKGFVSIRSISKAAFE